MVAMVTNRLRVIGFYLYVMGERNLVLCLSNYVSNEWWSYFKYSVWKISKTENSVLWEVYWNKD